MATAHKLFIVKTEYRVAAIQEVGMEDNFDPIVTMIEQFDASYLVQDGIISVVSHVVGYDRG